MKRRGEAATALIIAILAALGIGGAIYYFSQSSSRTPGTMPTQTSGDLNQEQKQELERVKALTNEINNVLSSTFGKYYPNALESFDFVPRAEAQWGNKKVSAVRNKAAYILPEEFVKKFSSIAKKDSLEIASDDFSIDINDGENFDLESELSKILHPVNDLNPGKSTQYIDENTVNSKISENVSGKSVDAFGYVRLIFKTDIKDVYIIAVFNIDPREVNHFKGRHIATGGKNILIAKSPDEILDNITFQVNFDKDFYILKFSLENSGDNSTLDECLEKFIAQFGE